MLGSHLSVAGGAVNALHEARRLKMDTVQIFTKNQRQWASAPTSQEQIDAWLAELHDLGWSRTVSHASYLINLASPDEELWAKSVDAMTDEVERAEALEVPLVVVHPGSHKGAGVEAGIANVARGLDEVIGRTRGFRAVICLENTVGGGHQLGGRFEELGFMRQRVRTPERIAYCFDTCHAAAAGYDTASKGGADGVFAAFDDGAGIADLAVFHLNDSMFPIGSKRDRHEHIGEGHVGRECFRVIMNDPRFASIPKILETPKGDSEEGKPLDSINLGRLRRMIRR